MRVQRFKLREGRMHSGDSNVFSKAESVQVLDGNILRDKQNVLCRGHIRKCTLSSAKEVRFPPAGWRNHESLKSMPLVSPFYLSKRSPWQIYCEL